MFDEITPKPPGVSTPPAPQPFQAKPTLLRPEQSKSDAPSAPSAPPSPAMPKVEDMFEEVTVAPRGPSGENIMTPSDLARAGEPRPSGSAMGTLVKVLLGILVIVILIIGTVLALGSRRQAAQEKLPPITPAAPVEPAPVVAPPVVPPEPMVAPAPRDTDNDGLTNEQEQLFGTDPTAADTDGDGLDDKKEVQNAAGTNPLKRDTDEDGLSDGEELNRYKTNALKKDTDGDGYDDGLEVSGGYNPNGPGKMPVPEELPVPAPEVPVEQPQAGS